MKTFSFRAKLCSPTSQSDLKMELLPCLELTLSICGLVVLRAKFTWKPPSLREFFIPEKDKLRYKTKLFVLCEQV